MIRNVSTSTKVMMKVTKMDTTMKIVIPLMIERKCLKSLSILLRLPNPLLQERATMPIYRTTPKKSRSTSHNRLTNPTPPALCLNRENTRIKLGPK